MSIIMTLKSWEEIEKISQDIKEKGKKIVFTNGCFDILHYGHVSYLEEAKNLADVLIVGLNSDESVKRLKGPSRPINGQSERAYVLGALKSVDYVVIFDQDTPYELIKLITPDILVKGGDWTPQQIVGSDIVLEHGGEVKSLIFKTGFSSTKIIDKINEEKENGGR
ncbi:D-glycero-beta-D-manno-heptose 1-phosphate adenylyltransferase [bacterium]|nr:D-glycero-beta-D-manno-heptose 1-phosphate adenylyltransferase [bacterium]